MPVRNRLAEVRHAEAEAAAGTNQTQVIGHHRPRTIRAEGDRLDGVELDIGRLELGEGQGDGIPVRIDRHLLGVLSAMGVAYGDRHGHSGRFGRFEVDADAVNERKRLDTLGKCLGENPASGLWLQLRGDRSELVIALEKANRGWRRRAGVLGEKEVDRLDPVPHHLESRIVVVTEGDGGAVRGNEVPLHQDLLVRIRDAQKQVGPIKLEDAQVDLQGLKGFVRPLIVSIGTGFVRVFPLADHAGLIRFFKVEGERERIVLTPGEEVGRGCAAHLERRPILALVRPALGSVLESGNPFALGGKTDVEQNPAKPQQVLRQP